MESADSLKGTMVLKPGTKDKVDFTHCQNRRYCQRAQSIRDRLEDEGGEKDKCISPEK